VVPESNPDPTNGEHQATEHASDPVPPLNSLSWTDKWELETLMHSLWFLGSAYFLSCSGGELENSIICLIFKSSYPVAVLLIRVTSLHNTKGNRYLLEISLKKQVDSQALCFQYQLNLTVLY
jgi:hypothetical protein